MAELPSFFSTPGLSGLLQQLKHLSVFGADVLVVEGETGSGKSALAGQLAKPDTFAGSSQSSIESVLIHIQEDEEASVFLFALLKQLGLSQEVSDTVGESLVTLRSYFQNLVREKRLVLVVLDDADRLQDEVLGALLSVVQVGEEQAFGFRFLMLAKPGFVSRIDSLGLVELAVYDFQMPEFSQSELSRFLSENRPEFDDYVEANGDSVALNIWNRSSGIPGRALSIVNSLLDSQKTSPQARSPLPLLHIGALLFLVGALSLLLIFRGGNSSMDDSQDESIALINPESEVSAGAASPKNAIVVGVPESKADGGEMQEDPRIEEPDTAVVIAPAELDAGSSSAGNGPGGNLGNSGEVYNEKIDFDENDPLRPKKADARPEAATQIDPAPVKDAETAKPVKNSLEAGLADFERRLLNTEGSNYFLQLVAASQPGTLSDYVSSQPNRASLSIYRRLRGDSGAWYIVVAGPYANRSEAQAAISGLPEAQRRGGPWPKSANAIQAEIEAFRSK